MSQDTTPEIIMGTTAIMRIGAVNAPSIVSKDHSSMSVMTDTSVAV